MWNLLSKLLYLIPVSGWKHERMVKSLDNSRANHQKVMREMTYRIIHLTRELWDVTEPQLYNEILDRVARKVEKEMERDEQ